MLEFIVKGKHLHWADDRANLVALGIGRFEEVTTSSHTTRSVIVNERLVLVSLFHWLRGDGSELSPLHQWLDGHMANSEDSARGFGFEDVMQFLFWDWFGDQGRPLSDVLQFESPQPQWAGETARLVSVFAQRTPDGVSQVVNKMHTSEIGYSAPTPEDSLLWFTGYHHLDQHTTAQSRCPILKPDRYFGPDLIFVLLLASGHELLICVQCKFWSGVHYKGEIEEELWKLSPEGFYRNGLVNGVFHRHAQS